MKRRGLSGKGNMKKLFLKVFVLLSTCICVACVHNVEYTYMNDESTIDSIQIVDLVDFKEENYEFVQEEICEIENIDEFIEEFSEIDCHVHYGDPVQLEAGVIVVKVVYENGDYELIDATAQLKRRQGVNHYGYRSFDREQFAELLKSYTAEDVDTEEDTGEAGKEGFFSKIDVNDEELSLMQQVLLSQEMFADGMQISDYMDNDDFINEYCKFWMVDLDEDEINEVCIYYESGGVLICHECEGNVEAYVVGSNAFGPVYTDGTFEGFGSTSNQGDLCGNVSFENKVFEYDVLTWWEDSYETTSRHYFKGVDRVEISKEEYDQIMSQYSQEKVTQYDFTIENILKYVE